MSHHSDDQLLQAGSDSFWEPGNYKRTAKRIDDGYRLCQELQQLIQERAEIEKGYAKNLKAWAKKWGELIEKGPEYGTTEAAWKGVLTESERLSDVHLKIKDNLCNDVTQQIKTWQKDNYHKTMMHIKERKEMEDSFKKAQKPWAKLLAKVEKSKSDYHAACKTEKTATNQERNATADSSLSPDQVKKMHDRVEKTKDEVRKCLEKYKQSLAEIDKYNQTYIDDMTAVFDKCQEAEKIRLLFFKDILFAIHSTLDITKDPSLPQIYEEFYQTIQNADNNKDLKWWSNTHGVNMPMNWPAFVEYTEEFRDIAKGSRTKEALPTAPITLINQRPVGEDLHDYPPPSAKNTLSSKNNNSNNVNNSNNSKSTTSNNTNSSSLYRNSTSSSIVTKQESPKSGSNTSSSSPQERSSRNSAVINGNGKSEANPFEEEEWDEGDNILVDNGEPGVPVKALYDYEGAESDELTFKQGEVFEKLEDEDEQGWCKGRKNGRVGLYPANYVEAISS